MADVKAYRVARLRLAHERLTRLLASPEPEMTSWVYAVVLCVREMQQTLDGEYDALAKFTE